MGRPPFRRRFPQCSVFVLSILPMGADFQDPVLPSIRSDLFGTFLLFHAPPSPLVLLSFACIGSFALLITPLRATSGARGATPPSAFPLRNPAVAHFGPLPSLASLPLLLLSLVRTGVCSRQWGQYYAPRQTSRVWITCPFSPPSFPQRNYPPLPPKNQHCNLECVSSVEHSFP
jgi:hypothetical protein